MTQKKYSGEKLEIGKVISNPGETENSSFVQRFGSSLDQLKQTVSLKRNKKRIKILFFLITPIILLIGSQVFLHAIQSQRIFAFGESIQISLLGESDISISQSSNSERAPASQPIVKLKTENSTKDWRAFVFDRYFARNNSPLEGYGTAIVDACERYGAPADCIAMIAIAQHETNLCKYANSAEMYNCLGWGGGGSNRVQFNSFEHMIDTAMDVLANSYGYENLINIAGIQSVYCGTQDECDGWGISVERNIEQLDAFSEEIGFGRLTELRE